MEQKTNRLVIKIGSSTITDNGTEVAIVTSGAVVSGKLRISTLADAIVDKQVAAMVGQPRLMVGWSNAFDKFGVETGQALYSDLDLERAKQPLLTALSKIVVVINANDAVNDDEMKAFEIAADNDNLAGHVAELIEARTLIILTDVAGILDEHGKHIPYADRLEDIEELIKREYSGTGGIWNKALIAQGVVKKGIRAVIANGREQDVLLRIMRRRGAVGTEFIAGYMLY